MGSLYVDCLHPIASVYQKDVIKNISTTTNTSHSVLVLFYVLNVVNYRVSLILTQAAAKYNDVQVYKEYSNSAHQSTRECTLRGQLEFNYAPEPLDLDQVESAASIVRRFCTGKRIVTLSGYRLQDRNCQVSTVIRAVATVKEYTVNYLYYCQGIQYRGMSCGKISSGF